MSEASDFLRSSAVFGGAVDQVDGVDHDRFDRRAGHRLLEGGEVLRPVIRRPPHARALVEDLDRFAAKLGAALDRLVEAASCGDMRADQHDYGARSRARPRLIFLDRDPLADSLARRIHRVEGRVALAIVLLALEEADRRRATVLAVALKQQVLCGNSFRRAGLGSAWAPISAAVLSSSAASAPSRRTTRASTSSSSSGVDVGSSLQLAAPKERLPRSAAESAARPASCPTTPIRLRFAPRQPVPFTSAARGRRSTTGSPRAIGRRAGAADRGHRPRAIDRGERRADPRRPAMAGARLGRGPDLPGLARPSATRRRSSSCSTAGAAYHDSATAKEVEAWKAEHGADRGYRGDAGRRADGGGAPARSRRGGDRRRRT